MSKKSELREKALARLNISPDKKLILTLDSGGVRGLITMQILQRLEEIAKIPCYELFDLVAGCGSASILAALISNGHTALESEAFYLEAIKKLYVKDNLLADRFINPPLYDKKQFRSYLKNIFKDLSLSEVVSRNYIDFYTAAIDTQTSSMASFTAYFGNDDVVSGQYTNGLMRNIIEATISAPTLFAAYDRFFDASSFISTNCTLQALLNAIQIGPQNKYMTDNLVVFNIGTGTRYLKYEPKKLINPEGIDAAFYLNYALRQSPLESSILQVQTLRCQETMKGLDYRRFNFSLDEATIKHFDNRPLDKSMKISAPWLWDVNQKDLDNINPDDVDHSSFALMLGSAFADYIMKTGGAFTKDLVDKDGKDLLINNDHDTTRINVQMSDLKFSDLQKS